MSRELREGRSEVCEGGWDSALWFQADQGEEGLLGVCFLIMSHATMQFSGKYYRIIVKTVNYITPL